MSLRLTVSDLPELARGAAFLGTGGGENPYIGRLMVERAMQETGRELQLLALGDLPDDALVIPTAMMGAPTCIVEKLPERREAATSLRRLEKHLGKRAFATMPIEAGGVNSMIPLVVGLRLGLPVVDADGMGRAFPELLHETFHIFGVSGTPMVITNDHSDQTLIETHDNYMMEWLARGITIRMGGVAYIAEYPMDGATAKRSSIAGTLGVGLVIGRALREAHERHLDPFAHLIATLHPPPTTYHPTRTNPRSVTRASGMTDSAMKARSPNGDGSWLPSARAASSSAAYAIATSGSGRSERMPATGSANCARTTPLATAASPPPLLATLTMASSRSPSSAPTATMLWAS
jgi:hypothetical protein